MLLSHQGGESSELEALGIQREDRRRRSLLFGFGAPAFFKAAITVTLSPENKLRISRGKIVTRYNSCPPDKRQDSSRRLVDRLLSTSRQTPIVVGESSIDLEHVPDETRERLLSKGVVQNGLILRPIIDLPATAGIRVGLIRVNAKLERIALEWPSYEMHDDDIEYVGT